MADRTAQGLVDKSVPVEEQQRRKRALIKGPKEFRDIREDCPSRKGATTEREPVNGGRRVTA